MTVEELIEKLKKFDPKLPVWLDGDVPGRLEIVRKDTYWDTGYVELTTGEL